VRIAGRRATITADATSRIDPRRSPAKYAEWDYHIDTQKRKNVSSLTTQYNAQMGYERLDSIVTFVHCGAAHFRGQTRLEKTMVTGGRQPLSTALT